MDAEKANLLAPTLFTVLLCIIVFNTVVFLGYYLLDKKKLLSKRLFQYWALQLFAFLLAPFFMEGNLQLSVPFSFGIFNLYFLYKAMFADHEKVPSYKIFLIVFFVFAWPFTIALEFLSGSFTLVTMPIAVALAAPMIYMFKLVWFDRRKRFRSSPHILMSFGFLAGAVHCINFSLFRDDPSNLIWGTTTHILIVTLYGIGISNFYNYMLHCSENIRLGKLVNEKTAELNKRLSQVESLKEKNETLLRVVLHDISNPMSAALGYLSLLKKLKAKLSDDQKESYLNRAMVASESVADIIKQVRLLAAYEGQDAANKNDKISLLEAFETAKTIFEPLYQKKQIELRIDLPGNDIYIKGNKELFIHSVLGNLLSNSLKFSDPGKKVILGHNYENNKIKVFVHDQGHGIDKEHLDTIFQYKKDGSTKGTHGESGNGFGMPLIKKYVEQNEGHIEMVSNTLRSHPETHGTQISVSFPAIS